MVFLITLIQLSYVLKMPGVMMLVLDDDEALLLRPNMYHSTLT